MDLVSNKVESGTIVYGAMSLPDKTSNRIVILFIQISHQTLQDLSEKYGEFYRFAATREARHRYE